MNQTPSSHKPAEPMQSSNTQHGRWTRYGSNTLAMVLATCAVVLLLNWIGFRHRGEWGRFDLTSTRRYTLSDQTQRLLDHLSDPVVVTTFYVRNDEEAELTQRIEDLIEEYDRRSTFIEAQNIDPASDVIRRQKFIEDLLKRYPDELDPAHAALDAARNHFKTIEQFASEQTTALGDLLASQPPDEATLAARQLSQAFLRVSSDLRQAGDQADRLMHGPLPDLNGARTQALSPIAALAANLSAAAQIFRKAVDGGNASPEAAESLLRLIRQYDAFVAELKPVAERLNAVRTPDYDLLRVSLMANHATVLSVPVSTPGTGITPAMRRGVVVLSFDSIYPNRQRVKSGDQSIRTEDGYMGEQTLSGAIARLTYRHRTQVVFLNPSPLKVLDRMNPRGGSWVNVANRLRQMNCDVHEWRPMGRAGVMGQVMNPDSKPKPDPDQIQVLVVLPEPPHQGPTPPNPSGPKVGALLQDHLDEGRPALVFVSPSDLESFGQANPVVAPLKRFGVNVDTARVALIEITGAQGKPMTVNQIMLNTWPRDHAIGQSLSGLGGVLLKGMPITFDDPAPEGAQRWPLMRTPDEAWADTEYRSPQEAKKHADDPGGPLTIAAAAELKGQRVVLIADDTFASDATTLAGPRHPVLGHTLYSLFPANAELFTNSVYWLAKLDDLVAPGAGSRDTRRIAEISRPQRITVWWLVLFAIPALCLTTGVVVWWKRRR